MSPNPVSLGSATWTNNSATLTLDSAQTINIEMCDGATGDWVQSANVTETKETTIIKEGSGARKLVIASGFTTGIIAYKNISTLNVSTKQKISFWIRVDATGGTVANTYRIDLCSDDNGTTPVNSFTIPIRLETARQYCITLSPDAGAGNLGSAIESIALYALLDPGSATVYVDNIIACTTNGLNIQSLVGKNIAGDTTWWTLKSINGTTVIFGESQQTGSSICNYSGDTESITTYNRETIKTDPATAYSTSVAVIQDSGSLGNLITFSGGWNPITNSQDGKTFFDGLNGWGYGIRIGPSVGWYTKYEKIALVRYFSCWHLDSIYSCEFDIEAYSCNRGDYQACAVFISGCYSNIFYNIITTCNDSGVRINVSRNIIESIISKGNYNNGILLTSSSFNNKIYNAIFGSNASGDINTGTFAETLYLENSNLLSTTEVSMPSTTYSGASIFSQKHDQTVGNHKKWVCLVGASYYTTVIDTTIFDVSSPSTRIIPGHAIIKSECVIAQISVDSGQTVTASVKVRESVAGDGTDYNGSRIRLLLRKNVAMGINSNTLIATATSASEGAFENIQGTSDTVTDNGVLEFFVDCDGTTGWISIDSVIIS